jgi:hypothetical protein
MPERVRQMNVQYPLAKASDTLYILIKGSLQFIGDTKALAAGTHNIKEG